MAEPVLTEQQIEDSFRESLKDMIVVVRKLAPHCKNLEDLLGMAQLATTNQGQLRFLMNEIQPLRLRQ